MTVVKYPENLTLVAKNRLNECISRGTIPNGWKVYIVTPIFKKCNKSDVANYRPVSFTCTASKIFEKLILSRMSSFLCANSPLPLEQFRFQSSRGCCQKRLLTRDFISKVIDNGSFVALIYFDFRKAFDMVP